MARGKIPERTRARWQGTYGRLYDGTELVPGSTVVEVGTHEAVASDNWHVLDKAVQKAVLEQAAGLDPVDSSLVPTPADEPPQEGDA